MIFGSLFSGIGGFDLGFERAGMTCVYQVEKDKDCQRVLHRRFNNVERYEDISGVGNPPKVDVLCGGFPCQDLSVAGKRAGLAGERSGLWFEFLRIVASTHPRFVVIENVPGLLSSNRGRDFAIILQGLVECGYGVAWRIFDAQYDHLAQRRERVFIVGSLGNGRAAEILFEPEGVCGDSPPSRKAKKNATAGAAQCTHENISPEIAYPIKGGEKHDESHQTYIPAVAWALQERDAKGPDSSTKDGHLIIANCFTGYSGGADDNDAQARHLVATAGVRRLTPTECERLQGFPDRWTAADAHGKPISDSARYRMLGNAVAVPVAEWIGRRLMQFATEEA